MARRRPTPGESPTPSHFTPLTLSPDARTTLLGILESAHARSISDLDPLLNDRVRVWRDLYEGAVRPGFKPWKDSSEIFFPLILMIADTARARMFQTLFQQRDVAAVESPIQDSDYELLTGGAKLTDDLSALRRFINHVALEPSELDLRSRLDAVFSEETQVGTACVRTFHDFCVAPRKKSRAMDGSVRVVENAVIRDRIAIQVIPIEQCFWDTTADEPANLRFWGFNYTVSLVELKSLAKQQGWSEADLTNILASPDGATSDAISDIRRREHVRAESVAPEIHTDTTGRIIQVSPFAQFTLREVWLPNADVDNDGILEDSVITWHPASGTLPRVILYPYIHNEMAVDVMHYEQRRNRFIGKPPGEPLVTIAAGVNSVANQTIDAQTVRNVPTLIVPEGSDAEVLLREQGWSPGQVLTERSQGEIRFLEFAQSGNAVVSMSIFDRLIDVAHRVAHLGQAQFGDVDVAQRAPASLGQSIMAEGAQLLDKIIARNRAGLSSILHKAVALYWQVQRDKFAAILGPDDASKVERLFNTVGLDRLRVSLNIVSAAHSRELDRQNQIAMMQLIMGFDKELLTLVNLVSGGVDPKSGTPLPPNPQLASVAAKVVRTAQTLMERIVESFPGVTDPAPLVPDVASDLEAIGGGVGQQPLPPPQGAPGVPAPGIGPGAGAVLPFPM